MREFLKRTKLNIVLISVLLIVVGVMLVVNPEFAAVTICRILGWILLISGVVSVITYFVNKDFEFGQFDLFVGLIETALGVFVVLRPESVVALLTVLLGAVLLLHGFLDIQDCVQAKRCGYARWWLILLLGIATVALGALIIWNPFTTNAVLMIVSGLSLIFDGVSDIVIVSRISKIVRQIDREPEDRF